MHYYPKHFVHALLSIKPLSLDDLQNQSTVQAWADSMTACFASDPLCKDINTVAVQPYEHHQEQVFVPVLQQVLHDKSIKCTVIKPEFFMSGDYETVAAVVEQTHSAFTEHSYITTGQSQVTTPNLQVLIKTLLQLMRDKINIQRYKGLGEMNPDQLWETTMDPEVRVLHQVKIDDAIAADQLFTVLMGDQVMPRKEYIESNAHLAENIDV